MHLHSSHHHSCVTELNNPSALVSSSKICPAFPLLLGKLVCAYCRQKTSVLKVTRAVQWPRIRYKSCPPLHWKNFCPYILGVDLTTLQLHYGNILFCGDPKISYILFFFFSPPSFPNDELLMYSRITIAICTTLISFLRSAFFGLPVQSLYQQCLPAPYHQHDVFDIT